MPTTEEARIAEIAAKVRESTETYSVPWQNSRQSLPVINLSLDSVLLNPSSHRIRAQIESHAEAGIVRSEPFSEQAQRIIEEILADTNGFHALLDSLNESGQLESGIVTHAGVLVNANTRAVALRQLRQEYIRVAVLPTGATEKEITELEARLQLARDYKQDYTFTNELLFIKEQVDAGMSVEELAILLGKAQSRNRAHLRKGVSEIEKSLRILQHIREVQELSAGAIPLTFFDPHESALTEADNAYNAIRDQDPAQARRTRDGRIAGVLVGVTYRNLRNWDSDQFLKEYVEPQFDEEDALAAIGVVLQPESEPGGANDDDGLAILERAASPPEVAIDPSQLLAAVAQQYGVADEAEIADGLTKEQLYESVGERLTQAAEERDLDRRDERRRSTPIKLVQEARQKVVRARESLSNSRRSPDFDRGKFNYALRQLRRELDVLAEANQDDA